jgi:hypothetical protein
LLGQTLNVVHPNISTGFSYKYVYPDKTTIWSGADYEAIKCLSKMLNFKIKLVKNTALHNISTSFTFSSSISDEWDGNWGGIVNKTTNAFNGMIGMVQRRVKYIFNK